MLYRNKYHIQYCKINLNTRPTIGAFWMSIRVNTPVILLATTNSQPIKFNENQHSRYPVAQLECT